MQTNAKPKWETCHIHIDNAMFVIDGDQIIKETQSFVKKLMYVHAS